MKKFNVTVEERVSQDFVIQADSQEEAEKLAQKLYKWGLGVGTGKFAGCVF